MSVPMRFIRYEVTGIPEATGRLDKLDAAGRDLGLAFFSIAQLMEGYEKQQFESEGGYGSGGWDPLSDAYRVWKEAHYPGKKILQRGEPDDPGPGPLMRSLTEPDAEGAIRVITPQMMEFGTSVSYARYHQMGTPRMPARPPLVLKIGVRGYFTRIIKDAIMAQVIWEQSGGFNGVGLNTDLSTP